MKKLLLSLVVICVAQVSFAQDAAFKADVLKYLDVSGASSNISMITKQYVKNVPADKQGEFVKDLDGAIKELMSKTADMYMTEFTHDDVKAILKFYESPVGKKLSSKTEVLAEKGQKVGEAWGPTFQAVISKYLK
ncbi:DUF2059 domain-containing protein [Flavobacterium sp. '19STA2R22 D10 B1']|uniref:DUF2059 domain-containing protein n=1 Tax=Flavobacterium aerium TaxID=3037261 RepID=UPI00278C3900|nr:DUF2059 domain-containing protein [Flavobacterium sp. '19STA2R22 D10 B1']